LKEWPNGEEKVIYENPLGLFASFFPPTANDWRCK